MSIRAYPLCWPDGWKRTLIHQRSWSRFTHQKRTATIADGVGRIISELEKLRVKRDDLVISTNVETRLDGLPRGDRTNPADPGVAVYWRKGQGKPMQCMAIDRYRDVAGNLCAVAATLEAMRAIERHGGAEVLERAFTGFAALPERASRSWREVLGLQTIETVTRHHIEAEYRLLARERHPDRGGSHEAMSELNIARELALAEIGA
jgi:hypothetical protein